MNNKHIIYQEVISNFKLNGHFDKVKNKCLHVGVFVEPYLSYIIEGKKTIESRFSKNKIAPYNKITKDDVIIVKKASGDIVGFIEITDIIFLDLTKTSIDKIKLIYGVKICAKDTFWEMKKDSRYATLIFIKKFTSINSFSITKNDMQSWIVL